MKDQEIISLILKGQTSKAFEVIYRNFPMIKKMIITAGGNSDEAKDIFQDSVIVLYRMVCRPDFTLNSSISTLLYSISKKLWLKNIRDVKSRVISLGDESDNKLSEEDSEEEWMEDAEKNKLAEKVLTELGEPCRSLLEKFYYENASMKEIAQAMGYSNERTAKAQKYKCIERSKKLLQEKIGLLKSLL
jgi:RNA polymerase sigma factor (sigma-70 family)